MAAGPELDLGFAVSGSPVNYFHGMLFPTVRRGRFCTTLQVQGASNTLPSSLESEPTVAGP